MLEDVGREVSRKVDVHGICLILYQEPGLLYAVIYVVSHEVFLSPNSKEVLEKLF